MLKNRSSFDDSPQSHRIEEKKMKPRAEGQTDASATLLKVAKMTGLTSSPTDDPVRFVLDLHRVWKKSGGKVEGKTRHSDRELAALLHQYGTPVKSLTPKLHGTTRLKSGEAGALAEFFLTHWRFVEGDDKADADKLLAPGIARHYVPLLSEPEIFEVRSLVVASMLEKSSTRSMAAMAPLPGKDTSDLICGRYEEADALITVSTEQTLIVTNPRQALIGFRNLINRLREIDRQDDRERVLIWVADLGDRSFDDEDSRVRFLNVESLISRFKALERFDDDNVEERWQWLQSNVVVVIRDVRRIEPTIPSVTPKMNADHVLLSAVPTQWASSTVYRQLYGKELERIEERNYTVFLSQSGWKSNPELDYDLRYYGHAQFNLKTDNTDDRCIRGLELPAPDRDYGQASRKVYAAARHTLGFADAIDGAGAASELRYLGFLVLDLNAFMEL